MSADRVLRTLIVKPRLGASYEALAERLSDDLTVREFVGLTLTEKGPSRSTLQENCRKVRPETLGAILQGFARATETREHERGEKIRVDCTPVAANVHFPSDSSLIWDSVRVLTRLAARAVEFGVSCPDRRRVAKQKHRRIYWARRKVQRVPVYRELVEVARQVAADICGVISGLRAARGPGARKRRDLAKRLQHFHGLLERVLNQTERRVFRGETVPVAEKVLSIFEEHVDLLVSGRTKTFGHKITLTVGASGLALDCVIERGNPNDMTLTTRQIERAKQLFGSAPKQVAFDGGFASRKNLEEARELGVERCAFSKGKGLTPAEMAGSRRTYGRLKRFRAGVEAWISVYKRGFGLDRCNWRGWRGFQAYVWSTLLSANLTQLARLRLRT